ncbi:MAG: GxxExxY protein [Candidatus Acidiferrales bacterium]
MNTDGKIEIGAPEIEISYPEQELTGKILECAFAVHNTLGCGFLERVYSNALVVEFHRHDLECQQQAQLKVKYRDVVVGDYAADLLVATRVLLELKACASLDPNHAAQIMNYLRASGVKVGLLLNFGRPKLEYRRFVC